MKKQLIVFLCLMVLLFCGCSPVATPVGPVSSTASESETVSDEPISSEEMTSTESSSEPEEVTSEESSTEAESEETSSEEISSEETTSEVENSAKTELSASDYRQKYFIRINRALNTATVYEKGEDGEFSVPVKAMAVSCGGSNTPTGYFNLIARYRWRLMVDDVYAQYASRVVGHILIHSVPYYTESAGDLCYRQFNKLGQTASHGCIRMTCADAKWVFDNCPAGTPVQIYDDYNLSGPLGKPKVQKIPTSGTYAHWDPTDPDPKNPWNNTAAPTISGAGDRELMVGDKFDPMAGVTASDHYGNDLTDRIKLTGKVDTSAEGTYSLSYTVTDELGNQTVQKVNITVTAPDDLTPPVIEADTASFEAESEAAGVKTIRSRIHVTDPSGIADSSVEAALAQLTESELTDEQGNPTVKVTEYRYLVTVTASDTCGNAATEILTFTFVVNEPIVTEPPITETE